MIRSRRTPRFLAILLVIALGGTTATAQETITVSLTIPWTGNGQVFPISQQELRYIGVVEGIAYLEATDGTLDEAFVRCPIIEDISAKNGISKGTANCEISPGPGNTIYAELNCKGEPGVCRGTFELVDGVGRFAGISGRGKMIVRSPVHALTANLANGSLIDSGSGLIRVDELEVSLPSTAQLDRE